MKLNMTGFNDPDRGGKWGDPELECSGCGIRLDPLMSKNEAKFFIEKPIQVINIFF